jgi:putative aminopeptidase FrvX
MDESQRAFLLDLLATATPSGFETAGQRVWVEYVSAFADEVHTDAYGNAVAVYEGGDFELALTGHGDEIGMMVRDITDDGFLKLHRIGGSDRTVARGQHITVHAADGPVHGVIGQTAIHLRKADDDQINDINELYVDIGVDESQEAEELVEVGDPVTFASGVHALQGTRLSARGMDNRIGIWAAAEALRRAAEREADCTVYAVSTVMEEVGLKGAKMVGFDLDPDAAIAADVTHATDTPESPSTKGSGIELGAGPVIARGSTNHPKLVEAVRTVAAAADIDYQLQATGSFTGTDADAFFTTKGGIPALNVGLPNRYMHTPVEVIDTDDLDALADLMAEAAVRAAEFAPYEIDL